MWIMWSFVQGYRNIEKELREIRLKCVKAAEKGTQINTKAEDPVNTMKNQLIRSLTAIAPK